MKEERERQLRKTSERTHTPRATTPQLNTHARDNGEVVRTNNEQHNTNDRHNSRHDGSDTDGHSTRYTDRPSGRVDGMRHATDGRRRCTRAPAERTSGGESVSTDGGSARRRRERLQWLIRQSTTEGATAAFDVEGRRIVKGRKRGLSLHSNVDASFPGHIDDCVELRSQREGDLRDTHSKGGMVQRLDHMYSYTDGMGFEPAIVLISKDDSGSFPKMTRHTRSNRTDQPKRQEEEQDEQGAHDSPKEQQPPLSGPRQVRG